MTSLMKSGKSILRILLLMFIFSVLNNRTIAQPILSVQRDPSFGIALLSWTMSDPGLQGNFIVERETESNGIWVELARIPYNNTITQYSYNDTISSPYCSTAIKTSYNFSYRIRFVSSANIDIFLSGIIDAALSDQTSPADVQNLNVTIINTFSGYNPRITWSLVTDDEIKSYKIQRFNGLNDNWPVITTVPSDSSGFTDRTISDVCDNSYRYIILTSDRCDNPSAPDYDLYVQTILLKAQQPGACDRVARLSWNSHEIIPGGIGGYKIYRSDNGSTPTEIEPASPKDTTYDDSINFVTGHIYTYSVKAYSTIGQYTSFSCEQDWKYTALSLPVTYITQASVEANNFVRVSYQVTPPSTVIKLILERSDDGISDFQVIDSLVGGIYVPDNHYIDDITADVNSKSYYYRLVVYDDCNGKTTSTNTARSILLQGSTDQIQNTLNWNSYETWTLGVESYKVYRILDEDPATIEMIGTTDQSTVSFVDLLSGVDPTKAVCYWIVANEISTSAISQSNTFCVSKEPLLFMPNAFYPDGINHLLRPVPKPAFVDVQSFKMTVFSRWGQQLFETTDITTGWNGIINGQNAPAGLYTYLLTYKSLEGKEYTKRGTAALIK